MTKPVSATLAAGLLALSLTACGSDPAPEAVATEEASPDMPAGISVTDGRMNIPAVAGNPAAVYFTVGNDSDSDVTISAVHVMGAGSASLHQTSEMDGAMTMSEMAEVVVPAHGSVAFAPGGMHVMAMDVAEGLEAGGDVEVTISFANGDKASFPVTLLAPGDTGDHSMHMGD